MPKVEHVVPFHVYAWCLCGCCRAYRRNEALIQELSTPPAGSQDLYFETQYSQSFFSQLKACLWKQLLSYWRNPEYNVIRIFFTFGSSILLGTMFWDLGGKR